jgi:hypothetical protein
VSIAGQRPCEQLRQGVRYGDILAGRHGGEEWPSRAPAKETGCTPTKATGGSGTLNSTIPSKAAT